MARLKTYTLNAFDYASKGRKLLVTVATSRREAVAIFNGQTRDRAFTDRISVGGAPEGALIPGMVYLVTADGPVYNPEVPLSDEDEDVAVKIAVTILPMGFARIPAAAYARYPERRWYRDGIVVALTHDPRLGQRVSVSTPGYGVVREQATPEQVRQDIASVEKYRREITELLASYE